MRDKEEMKALKEEVILFNMGANKIIQELEKEKETEETKGKGWNCTSIVKTLFSLMSLFALIQSIASLVG